MKRPHVRSRKITLPRIPHWLTVGMLGAVAMLLFILGGIIIWAAVMPIPAINDFENRQVAQSTKIYDRTGNVVLYDVHGAVRRTSVLLDQISPMIQDATVSIEDDTFWQNSGFRPLSFLRAMFVDIFAGQYAQGGSTITQQVVKNTLLTQSKTIPRKIEEIILALRLTRSYSKDQILSAYLNEVPYGGTIYGVEEASQHYFGVSSHDVDIAEAAYLAALPQAPTYLSPYGNHRSDLDARKDLVLSKMKNLGYITADQYNSAKAETVTFKTEVTAGIKAPHFVFYVLEYLEKKYGVDAVEQGGMRVITSLDYDLQQKMESVVSNHAPDMLKNFNAHNEAMVAIDPKTGQILAMMGSPDYFNDSIQGKFNDALALRQPGSSFKPFVYATAFEKGYTPGTVVFDLKTQFSTACSPQDVANNTPPCYSAQNYDQQFVGPITLRDAIAQSRNIPSLKTLYVAGIPDSIKTAQDLGITSLGDPSLYGLTLVLGGGEVSLLEETGAYGVFANDGVKNPTTGILQVIDKNGSVLEQYSPQPIRVLDPQIARQISSVLSDDTARAPDFGVHGPLWFDGADVADKTGTTNDSRDAWILGYTPSIAVGAWAGNNNNSPMVKNIAAFIVTPMWHDFMAYAIQKYPADNFPPPAPDPAFDSLPPVLKGNWNTDPSKGVHDLLYWVQKSNPRAGPPANPWSDPQMAYWDYPVQLWVAAQGSGAASAPALQGVATTDQYAPSFEITSPVSGVTISGDLPIDASVGIPSQSTVASVTYIFNGVTAGVVTTPPYNLRFSPHSRGPSILQVIFHLQDGSSAQSSVSFTLQ